MDAFLWSSSAVFGRALILYPVEADRVMMDGFPSMGMAFFARSLRVERMEAERSFETVSHLLMMRMMGTPASEMREARRRSCFSRSPEGSSRSATMCAFLMELRVSVTASFSTWS